jgi:GAF domain-containing protein
MQLIEEPLALAARQLGMEATVLGEVTDDAEVVRHVAGAAESMGATFCEQLLERRIGSVVPDTHAEPHVANLPATREAGIRSYIGVPFTLGDARLYVLCCLSRERQPRLGEREVAFLRGVAESVRQQLQG